MDISILRTICEHIFNETRDGPPARPSNPLFDVGPISYGMRDEVESRLLRQEFENWLEATYRKTDAAGTDVGGFTPAELVGSVNCDQPADQIATDMMAEIHRFLNLPAENKIAIDPNGGESGFITCILHMVSGRDDCQRVYIDTPRAESPGDSSFFKKPWTTQLFERLYHTFNSAERLRFAAERGVVPPAAKLTQDKIQLFIGVGHDTTDATTYTEREILELLAWLDEAPTERHALIDVTSMLGAMPWGEEISRRLVAKCCLFMPLHALGGTSGYYVVSFTPQAMTLIQQNIEAPAWTIPQPKLPVEPALPFTSARSIQISTLYDANEGKMTSSSVNAFSVPAFAETTFRLRRSACLIGDIHEMNRRSAANRDAVAAWIAQHPLFTLSVSNPARRSAAMALIKVEDPDISDMAIRQSIVAKSKQLLSYQGILHAGGKMEQGLNIAGYVNAVPGMEGDYCVWIGGNCSTADITALLNNLRYAYLRAKLAVLSEELVAAGEGQFSTTPLKVMTQTQRAPHGYRVLVMDLVGLAHAPDGTPDPRAVKAHVEAKGGTFHFGPCDPDEPVEEGNIAFFYQPHLHRTDEILAEADGRYDAVIAAATTIPADAIFPQGGVRIGTGTGNMQSRSWGGPNGGGAAPLMNTPSFNSRATAQMALKAILRILPDLPVEALHRRVLDGTFDTSRDLYQFPTTKLEGKHIAILGYGNIGRELAKLCRALNMFVTVYARSHHRDWILSEGFLHASTIEEAVAHADVISVHIGLGSLCPERRQYANAGAVGQRAFSAMKEGTVLVNYDRGEVVDTGALDIALANGTIRHCAVDADLFIGADGTLSGSLVPYRELAARHSGKLELLPHAAADTDHPSRVDGAKQAVDQIYDAILHRIVCNAVGSIPKDYRDGGPVTVRGVGKVTDHTLLQAFSDTEKSRTARLEAERLAAMLGALNATIEPAHRSRLLDSHAADLLMAANRLSFLLRELGIEGRR